MRIDLFFNEVNNLKVELGEYISADEISVMDVVHNAGDGAIYYICCDIVDPELTNHKKKLDLIYGKQNHVFYHKVVDKSFNEINFNIEDSRGVPASMGNVETYVAIDLKGVKQGLPINRY